MVYRNEKPVRLSGDDLPAYLPSIPSDATSKIEVIQIPPSNTKLRAVR
ncbi:MAG: hypothetical protein ABIN24_00355 [Dyadobacter sp.]